MKKIIFAVMCLLLAFQCSAEIILVKPDGSGDQPTIQAAIDAAYEGDEVVLAIGTYTGDGNRDIDPNGKAVTIRSTDPNDPDIVAATVIDCNGSWTYQQHRAFYFQSGEDADTILNGLTITNGCAGEGGGIYCAYSNPVIANCTFSGNSAEQGGAIWNERSNSAIINCSFTGNFADGGGAMFNVADNSTITNCTFSDNSTEWGGGAMYNSSSNLAITNCLFTGNSTEWGGGAMLNYCSSPVITNCAFIGNMAKSEMFNRESRYNKLHVQR
jgi:hypothetical protein